MFLDSTILGFKILRAWEFYVIVIGISTAVSAPSLYFSLLAEARHTFYPYGKRLFLSSCWKLLLVHFYLGFDELITRSLAFKMAGGKPALFFIAFCEIFSGYYSMLTLSPIILGVGAHADWTLPFTLPFHDSITFTKIVGMYSVAELAIGLMNKYIPRIISSEVLLGSIILACRVRSVDRFGEIEIFPSFWFCFGLIALAFIAKWLLFLLLLGISMLGRFSFAQHRFLTFWGPFIIGPIYNYMPIWVYGGWLALQIRTHFPIQP